MDEEEEVAIKMDVFNESRWTPVDTAALSIWVDRDWYLSNGGEITSKGGAATAVDGSDLNVEGTGVLQFAFWGLTFRENVRVMTNLPDKLLIGRRFWRKLGLRMDLETNIGSIRVDNTRHEGPVGRGSTEPMSENVNRVLEGNDVDYHIKHELDCSQFSKDPRKQQKLRELLWKHRNIFKGMGKISGVKHKINLKPDAKPICQPVRRRSPKEQGIETDAMNRLLDLGVLEPAVSPWAANNVFVKKKDGGMRVTSDFRALNAATVTDSYPMEDMRQILGWLASKNIFSSFDLKDGFYQVELAEESKPLTAIRTVLGLLQYTRLPMGMKNSPGTFQRIVNLLLGDRKGRDVLAFIDDVNLGTEDEDEHLEKLDSLLTDLYRAGVRLKLSKCSFGVRKVEVLGHRVDEMGVSPSAAHVDAIKALTEPASGDELMRFLGMVNFFSDFVDHFAEIAAPLYEVLKGTGFSRKKRRHGQRLIIPDWDARWGQSQRGAWRELKAALSDPQILTAPIRGAQKKVMTDASSYGLGAVLLQEGADGKWRPVAFTSKLMKKAERNYTPTEKECLAVVHALQKWRHYLHGEEFVVVTDHLALRWLLSLKDPRERLARWVIEIQDYDFTVEHRAGKELVVPDTLSRDAVPKPLCQRCYAPLSNARLEEIAATAEKERVEGIMESMASRRVERVAAIAEINGFAEGPTNAELRDAQAEQFGDLQTYAEERDDMVVDEHGVLRVAKGGDLAVLVPNTLTDRVLKHVHGSRLQGHYKLARTLAKLKGRYWWKNMIPDTIQLLKNCLQCTVSEDRQPGRQAPMEVVHPKRRFQQVAIDVQTITPRTTAGNDKILVIIDLFTRFVRALAIPNEKAETIARALITEWIAVFGPMEILLTDGGTSIAGKIIDSLVQQLGIDRLKTYPLHPQANGTVERWNRTIARDIASFMTTGDSDWDEHVALACFRYNTGVCSATGMTPFKAMFGVDAFEAWGEVDFERADQEPESLAKRLSVLHKQLLGKAKKARRRAKGYYDRAVRETKYQVGDRVLLWSVKLNKEEGKKVIKPWIGPYVVTKRLGRVGYELLSEIGNKVTRVHANRLRKISDGVTETGDPESGMFPDSLRILKKISGAEVRQNPETGRNERWFKVRIKGRSSPAWTKESDLPEAVVRLFDRDSDTAEGCSSHEDDGQIDDGILDQATTGNDQATISNEASNDILKDIFGDEDSDADNDAHS